MTDRNRTLKRIILVLALAVLLLLIASGVYVYLMLSKMQVSDEHLEDLTLHEEIEAEPENPNLPTINKESLQTPPPEPKKKDNSDYGIINIAVFGMDNRYKHTIIGGRSDVNIILTIDKNTNDVRLTSIIRDTLIYVDELNDYNRINAAIVYANGPEGAVRCIENEFDIDIDHYMVTNFVSMAKILDAIGGVNINITSSQAHSCTSAINELNSLMGYSEGANMITHSGNVRLNGIQAVAYMRQRKQEGGFARDDKQKTVLLAARNNLTTLSVDELENLLVTVTDNIRTDMSPIQLMNMTMNLYNCRNGSYDTLRLPLDGTYKLGWYNKMSVVQYDKEINLPVIHDFIYEGKSPNGN